MSYVYIQSEPRLWTAGFYDPDGKFHPESDHGSRQDAAERAHYLNGGTSAALVDDWRTQLTAANDETRAVRELVAEILADFWPGERFDGISEGLRDAQARVDDYRKRAGLEPQS